MPLFYAALTLLGALGTGHAVSEAEWPVATICFVVTVLALVNLAQSVVLIGVPQ